MKKKDNENAIRTFKEKLVTTLTKWIVILIVTVEMKTMTTKMNIDTKFLRVQYKLLPIHQIIIQSVLWNAVYMTYLSRI
jgi:hypothetical protein